MKPLLALATLAALLATAPGPADARKRHHGWDDGYDRWENRRDARRAGVIAGVVAAGVASSAAESRADDRYRECMMSWGYDYECERRYYEDRRDARRTGRAVGATAGMITREIVRD